MNNKKDFFLLLCTIFNVSAMEQNLSLASPNVQEAKPNTEGSLLINETDRVYYLRVRDKNFNNISDCVKDNDGIKKLPKGHIKFSPRSRTTINVSSEVEVHVRIWESENLIPSDGRANSIIGFKWERKKVLTFRQHKLQLKEDFIRPILVIYVNDKKPFAFQDSIYLSQDSGLREINISCSPDEVEYDDSTDELLLKMKKSWVERHRQKMQAVTVGDHDKLVQTVMKKYAKKPAEPNKKNKYLTT